MRNKRNEILNHEIQQDREALAKYREALAKYVAEYGDPAAELREMFEQSPDAIASHRDDITRALDWHFTGV